jgi:hypothetical protein
MTRLRDAVLAVFFVLTIGIILSSSAFAGSAVVGSVAGSMNATVGGHEVVPNATIFSGDSLQVKEGVAVIAVGRGSRMVFGRESTVSFSREADSVTAVLGQGNVSVFYPDGGVGVRVKVGEVTIAPAKGFKTLGEVAMANGTIVVSTKEGLLRVEGNGPAVEVAKGKTVAVMPKKAAGAPQGGSGGHGHSVNGIEVATLGAAGVGAVLGGVAYHSANEARDNANSAIAAANAATAAANAATAAANAATDAANTAAANANMVGCALDQYAVNNDQASPYYPPEGYSCNVIPPAPPI